MIAFSQAPRTCRCRSVVCRLGRPGNETNVSNTEDVTAERRSALVCFFFVRSIPASKFQGFRLRPLLPSLRVNALIAGPRPAGLGSRRLGHGLDGADVESEFTGAAIGEIMF